MTSTIAFTGQRNNWSLRWANRYLQGGKVTRVLHTLGKGLARVIPGVRSGLSSHYIKALGGLLQNPQLVPESDHPLLERAIDIVLANTNKPNSPKVVRTIYDREFILTERADSRFTIVFDFDQTLAADINHEQFFLRPHMKELIEELKRQDIKIVIWSKRINYSLVTALYDLGIYDLCDVIIPAEAFMPGDIIKNFVTPLPKAVFLTTDMIKLIRKTLGSDAGKNAAAFFEKFPCGKFTGLLGYELIIDDNESIKRQVAIGGGAALVISKFNHNNDQEITSGEAFTIKASILDIVKQFTSSSSSSSPAPLDKEPGPAQQ